MTKAMMKKLNLRAEDYDQEEKGEMKLRMAKGVNVRR